MATMFCPFNAALPCGLASKGLALDLEDPHKYPDRSLQQLADGKRAVSVDLSDVEKRISHPRQ